MAFSALSAASRCFGVNVPGRLSITFVRRFSVSTTVTSTSRIPLASYVNRTSTSPGCRWPGRSRSPATLSVPRSVFSVTRRLSPW